MAGFSDAKAALVGAAFATFGEPASWTGIAEPVTVRLKSRDADDGYAGIMLIERSILIRVRRREVPQPAADDQCVIVGGDHAGTYAIAARPMLDAKGVWTCLAIWSA